MSVVFFSIPCDAGWSAKVDGRPADIEKVNTGFLGLMLPAGKHSIVFRYFPPGLREGILVSGVALLLLLTYVVLSRTATRRNSAKRSGRLNLRGKRRTKSRD
jgi:uncharacterized membrane protein YfhO